MDYHNLCLTLADFCFLPQEEAKEEKVVDDDKLDQLLREFEKKTNE